MSAGTHGNAVRRDVDAKLGARGCDTRKTLRDELGVEMTQVKIHVCVPRLLHLADDRLRNNVARRQFAALVVVVHEAVAVSVDQVSSFAAEGFGDQTAAAAGDVQHGGMELHELHVPHLGTGPVGDCVTVRCGNRRVGRLTIELPGAARAQNGLLRPDRHPSVPLVSHQRSAANSVVSEQVQDERVFPDRHVAQLSRPFDHRPHHFLAGGVAQCMDDPKVAVSAFATQDQLSGFGIETGSPLNQFANPLRGLAHHHFHNLWIAQPAARANRVLGVSFELVVRIDNAGNASLGVGAGGLLELVFGDQQHGHVRFDSDRRPQPGQPTADNEHVGEEVRDPLGMKWDKITREVFVHRSEFSRSRLPDET